MEQLVVLSGQGYTRKKRLSTKSSMNGYFNTKLQRIGPYRSRQLCPWMTRSKQHRQMDRLTMCWVLFQWNNITDRDLGVLNKNIIHSTNNNNKNNLTFYNGQEREPGRESNYRGAAAALDVFLLMIGTWLCRINSVVNDEDGGGGGGYRQFYADDDDNCNVTVWRSL